MRCRPLIAALLVAGAAAATPSSAAAVQIVDKADDANYLNDNAPVVPPIDNPANHTPTPTGSTPAADILSVEWRSLYDRRGTAHGFTVTMVLKAAPTRPNVLYRVLAASTGCAQFWLEHYSTKVEGHAQTALRHNCGGGTIAVVPVPVRITNNVLVWTVDLRQRDLPREVRVGTEFDGLLAHSRDYVDAPGCVATVPCPKTTTQYDTTKRSTSTYTVGQQ